MDHSKTGIVTAYLAEIMQLAALIDLEGRKLGKPDICAIFSYYGPSREIDIYIYINEKRERYTIKTDCEYKECDHLRKKLIRILHRIREVAAGYEPPQKKTEVLAERAHSCVGRPAPKLSVMPQELYEPAKPYINGKFDTENVYDSFEELPDFYKREANGWDSQN